MHFDATYFIDEIREGFYIPGMVKRSWAVQIETLKAVADICKRHNIKWFADCGTMLGAVRHRGFIPWDDDMDIGMLRDDYIRFIEVAQKELPKGYKVINFQTEESYAFFLTRIVNNDKINIGNEFLKSNHGFPYVAGIDIFPWDYLYPDEKIEDERRQKAVLLYDFIGKLDSFDNTNRHNVENQVFKLTGHMLERSTSMNSALFRLLDSLFAEYDGSKAEYVTRMPGYIKNKNFRIPVNYFATTIPFAFENVCVELPVQYSAILNIRYKKWYQIRKSGGSHEYPFFKEQENILLGNKGQAPYVFLPPRDKATWINKRHEHLKKTCYIEWALQKLIRLSEEPRIDIKDSVQQHLDKMIECQAIAIDLGQHYEEKYGEETEFVRCMEEYCELIFVKYNQLLNMPDEYEDSWEALSEKVQEAYDIYINNKKKTVLFVPVLAKDWKYMSLLYSRYLSEGYNVYVMPALFSYREDDGKPIEYMSEYDLFSDVLHLVRPTDFDLNIQHPDAIVIQNPYDEYASGFTVHPHFYSEHLFCCTEQLVYVQSFACDRITEDDVRGKLVASRYIIMPGCYFADKIYVNSEDDKKLYLELMSKAFKEGCASIAERMAVLPSGISERKLGDKLLIHFSIGDLLSSPDAIIKAKIVLESIANHNSDIPVLWIEDEWAVSGLSLADKEVCEEYLELQNYFIDNHLGDIKSISQVDNRMEEVAGYYGSPGYVMNQCMRNRIPVMLWNSKCY